MLRCRSLRVLSSLSFTARKAPVVRIAKRHVTWIPSWGKSDPGEQRPYSAQNLASATELSTVINLKRASPSQLIEKGDHKIQTLVAMVTEEQAKDSIQLNFPPHDAFEKLLPQPLVLPAAALSDFKGKEKEAHFLYPTWEGSGVIPRVLLVGLGKEANISLNSVRSATHSAIAQLRSRKLDHAAYLSPKTNLSKLDVIDAISRTAVLSNHTFDKYLSKDSKGSRVDSLTMLCESDAEAQDPALVSTMKQAQTIAECTVMARELVNDRADSINPKSMQAFAQTVASAHKLRIHVFLDSKLRGMGYHLLPSVGQAAHPDHRARLVVLEYNGKPEAPNERIALVGKGITFDTGGLNLKPTGSMENMHMDMGGSAAVLSTIKAATMLGLKVNLVAALALAENAIGRDAVKPHTIVKSSKGSVEISNTDAEGRLALADAFAYVQKTYKPQSLIDVATLTGACVVALGEYAAGLFSNSDLLADALMESGRRTFERTWRLPIFPEHTDELKGTYSDMRSTGKDRYGGACTAAAFLQKFIDDGVRWAHLDIAGPGMYSAQRDFMCQGGTGFGVQLLTQYLSQTATSK